MDVQQTPASPVATQQPPISTPPPVPPPVLPMDSAPIHSSKRWYIFWWTLATFFLLFIGVFAVYLIYPRGDLIVADQVPGRTIHVNRVFMTRVGWLIIFHVSIEDGINEIAVTTILDPEDYREFDLLLKPEMPDLAPGDQLSGVLYEDTDGDQNINTRFDKPMRDMFGRQIRVSFRVK